MLFSLKTVMLSPASKHQIWKKYSASCFVLLWDMHGR